MCWKTEEAPGAEGDSGAIPAPPSAPLPPLAALSKAQPSPLLRWQLVDILFSYCLTLRLYNGEWASDPQVLPTLCGHLTCNKAVSE